MRRYKNEIIIGSIALILIICGSNISHQFWSGYLIGTGIGIILFRMFYLRYKDLKKQNNTKRL